MERRYAVQCLQPYWAAKAELILDLPIIKIENPDPEPLPPQVEMVRLPEWAEEIGVDGRILVPAHLILTMEGSGWKRTDWLRVIFWYLNGSAERAFEKLYGPIHSYAFRLKGWDTRLWEHAWVNRIALFLRRWAARAKAIDEKALFGPLPKTKIVLTHDVDCITKTLAVRFKTAAFYFFHVIRSLLKGQLGVSLSNFSKAVKFLISNDDYWCFDHVTGIEENYGLRSHFYVYGGLGGWQRDPKQLLFDPAYKVNTARLKQQLRKMQAKGWTIGLHQSYKAWGDAHLMASERWRVEKALDAEVNACRQHWLRFSWTHTWKAQQEAGLSLDSTFGFNDRPAFRNGAALRFRPWDPSLEKPMKLETVPTVLMDSHFYFYADLNDSQRHQQLAYWLDEINSVKGTAAIIWHQRVMARDYGWERGYRQVLELLSDYGLTDVQESGKAIL